MTPRAHRPAVDTPVAGPSTRAPGRAVRGPAMVGSVILAVALAAPAPVAAQAQQTGPQEAFWGALRGLCGQAFEGEVVESAPAGTDADFEGRRMVMHVRVCEDDVIAIPFHVGEDRSRTWIVRRTEDGLRLKHDHRSDDGTPHALTMYGGNTDAPGTATRQEFPADAATAEMLPAAAGNVWTVGVEPGSTFTYALRREGTDRRFRAVFDLSRPVTPPAGSAALDYRDEFLRHFEQSSRKMVLLSEAMPADLYEWSPGEGVMSVARVYAHIARYNYLYLTENLGVPAPADVEWRELESLTDRNAVRSALLASIEHVRRAVNDMDEGDLTRTVSLYGRDVTGWAVLFQLLAHMNEHVGQSIAYARMNGIVPPWSR